MGGRKGSDTDNSFPFFFFFFFSFLFLRLLTVSVNVTKGVAEGGAMRGHFFSKYQGDTSQRFS